MYPENARKGKFSKPFQQDNLHYFFHQGLNLLLFAYVSYGSVPVCCQNSDMLKMQKSACSCDFLDVQIHFHTNLEAVFHRSRLV